MSGSVKLSLGVVFFVVAILSSGRTCLADPTATITAPLDGQFITGASFDISGTASDDTGFGIQKVQVNINGSGWHDATDTSGGSWATWSYPVTVHASGLFMVSCQVVVNNLNYAGNVAHSLVTIPTHSISGSTSYSGSKPGNIFVAAFGAPEFDEDLLAFVGPIGLGAYTMPNVQDGTYYVAAVKALVGSNGPIVLLTTPFGAYGGAATPTPVVLSGANATGINIALQDTLNNPISTAYVQPDYLDLGDPSGNHMVLEFIYEDPYQQAGSVTVSGAGLGSPLSLTFDSSYNEWVSWLSPSSDLDLGANSASWPTPPQTYTFTVNLTAGGQEVHYASVKRYLTDLATITSPMGNDVYGSLIFSWLYVPTALQYRIQLVDSVYNHIWEKEQITGSSYTYDGPTLQDGQTYYYFFESRAGTLRSEKGGSFIYHSSTDTSKPTAAITYPAGGSTVGGDKCTVTGTASDTGGAGAGIQRVEISFDNGANWIPAAYDTSASGTWSTWAFDWPLATAGSYTLKARAVDISGNAQATPASISVTVAVDHTAPTSTITSPANGSYVKTVPVTIKGTAADNTGGTGIKQVEVGLPDGRGGTSWELATGTTSWSYTGTPPADGVYNIKSRATDNADNVETPGAGITTTVDTTAPYSAITSPTGGAVISGTSVTVSGTAGDDTSGVAKVEISTNNGSTWTTLPSSATSDGWAHWAYTWTLPATGNYTLKTRATDKAGNVETPGAGVSVKVDKTAPTTTITSPLNGALMPPALSTYSIKGNATDTGSGVQAVETTWDNGSTWHACTYSPGPSPNWSYAWSPADDGTYTIKARVTDFAGNSSAIVTGPKVYVDRNPPVTVITQPLNDATISATTYAVKGTASDSGKGVTKIEVSFNGGATWAAATGTTSWSYNWSVPANGNYTITIRATDGAGNAGTTSVNVTVDKSIPSSIITAPANGARLKGSSYTVKGTAVGGVGSGYTVTGVEVSYDGGTTWHPATGTSSWSYTWTLPADGTYLLLSRATNNFSVVEDATHKTAVTVNVDSTNPASAVTYPAPGDVVKGASITVTGTASDATSGISKVQVSTNGGGTWATLAASATTDGWATWSYKWTLPATGTYVIKTKATDGAGNVEVPGAGVSVTVDKTVPTVKVTNPLNGAVMPAALSTYSIQGTAADAGSGVQKVEVTTDNGASWGEASGTTAWSYPWSPVSDGSYTVKVRSTDVAGNVSAVTTGPTVKVDRTAPTAVITAPAGGAFVTGASYIIKGTATDGTGSGLLEVDVSTDGGTNWKKATGTATWSYTWPLTGGDADYTIKVRAIDKALNTYTSSGITVTVDAKPISSISSPTAGAVISAPTVIAGTASDGTGTVTKVEVTFNGTTWYTATGTTNWSYSWSTLPADGTYTIKSRATDSTNQVETPGAGVSVKVDTKAPTTVISSPAAGATVGAALTVKGTASDGTGSGVALVECSIDGGGTWQPATGTTSWTCNIDVASDGPLTILARATDNVGNVQATPTSRAVKADIVAPTAAITAPADGAVIATMSYTVKGTASDGTGSGLAKVEVSVDDGATWKTATGTSSWTYAWTLTTTDTFYILARATDKAGNVGDPMVIYITVSPQVLSGTWTYKAVPYAGGTTKTGTFTMSVTDTDGNGTITFGNTCHTIYTGGYFGMSAYFDTNNEAYNSCTGYGDLWFDMTDLKHGGGDWTTDNLYYMTISR